MTTIVDTDTINEIETEELLSENELITLREEIDSLNLDNYSKIFTHLKNTNKRVKFDESTKQYIKLYIVKNGGAKIRSVGNDYFTIQVSGKPMVYMPYGAVSLRT